MKDSITRAMAKTRWLSVHTGRSTASVGSATTAGLRRDVSYTPTATTPYEQHLHSPVSGRYCQIIAIMVHRTGRV